MAETIETRLKALGITLPSAAAPAANYVPFTRAGNLLFVSGQLPLKDGKLVSTGLLGRDLDVAAGREAARQCAINILAQAKAAAGSLDKVKSVLRISVLVASAPDFTEQHLVGNGASDLLVEVLGDAGKHSRVAVGMAALPLNAAVEVESILELH
ncbi:MAG TPA: RidA family protein [Rhizobiaceae bacterium]|nr:RidA family protein [Rhizobiaceae bacterium]